MTEKMLSDFAPSIFNAVILMVTVGMFKQKIDQANKHMEEAQALRFKHLDEKMVDLKFEQGKILDKQGTMSDQIRALDMKFEILKKFSEHVFDNVDKTREVLNKLIGGKP